MTLPPITFTEERLRSMHSSEAVQLAAAFFAYASHLRKSEEPPLVIGEPVRVRAHTRRRHAKKQKSSPAISAVKNP